MNFVAVLDPVNTISVVNFETSAIELAPADVTASESPQPGGDRRYPLMHFLDTEGTFTIRFQSTAAAPAEGMKIGYTIGGTAVEDTHFAIPSGSVSPVTMPEGETTVDIPFDIINTGTYHTEKLITFTLSETGLDGWLTLNEEVNELRVWIESTTVAPEIEFDVATQTITAGNPATITVNKIAGGTAHEDNIAIHVETSASGSMVEGTEYDWAANPFGAYTISPAGSSRNMTITTDAAASGETITLTLWHDLSDKSDYNQWSQTHDMRLERELTGFWPITQYFPGDESDNGPGPAGSLTDGVLPLTYTLDGTIKDPFGTDVYVFEQVAGATGSGYHRKNLNGWLYASAHEDALQALPLYTRVSIYVRAATTGELPRFVQLGMRNRGATFRAPQVANGSDENHNVLFDNESADGSAVSYEGKSWYIYDPADVNGNGDPNDLAGTTGGSGCDWGINREVHRMNDGTTDTLLRLWIIYHEGDASLLGNQWTCIWWPIIHKAGERTVAENDGARLCAFWPMKETSSSVLSGAPPRYKSREGFDWAPRGNATTSSAGQNTHVITVT